MKKLLLVTVPFLNPLVRYYPAAYVAGITTNSGWECDYLDLNREIFLSCPDDMKKKWVNGKINQISEEVRVTDGSVIFETDFKFSLEAIRAAIEAKTKYTSYDLVGVSMYDTCRMFSSIFVREFRSIVEGTPILYGGPDCFPAHYGKNFLNSKYAPDIVLQGEAEVCLPEFLHEFSKSGKIETEIPGFIYRGKSGHVCDTGTPVLPNLKNYRVVSNFSIYPVLGDGQAKTLATFTSKGCT